MNSTVGVLLATLLAWSAAALGQTLPEWLESMNSEAPMQRTDSSGTATPESTATQSSGQGIQSQSDTGPLLEEYEIAPLGSETVAERNARQAALEVQNPQVTAVPETPVAGLDRLYGVQPSDVLQITVWHEPELGREVAVSPDGRINYPLIGSVYVEGKSVEAIGKEIEAGLTTKFMKQAAVTVTIKEVLGNRIYVLGQVNRPGAFPFTKSLDVMQALSLAGGAAKFAALDDIRILRRVDGVQKAFAFDYSQVLKGRKLEQNILLENGDVIMVP